MWSVKTSSTEESNQLHLNHSFHKAQLQAVVRAKKDGTETAPPEPPQR